MSETCCLGAPVLGQHKVGNARSEKGSDTQDHRPTAAMVRPAGEKANEEKSQSAPGGQRAVRVSCPCPALPCGCMSRPTPQAPLPASEMGGGRGSIPVRSEVASGKFLQRGTPGVVVCLAVLTELAAQRWILAVCRFPWGCWLLLRSARLQRSEQWTNHMGVVAFCFCAHASAHVSAHAPAHVSVSVSASVHPRAAGGRTGRGGSGCLSCPWSRLSVLAPASSTCWAYPGRLLAGSGPGTQVGAQVLVSIRRPPRPRLAHDLLPHLLWSWPGLLVPRRARVEHRTAPHLASPHLTPSPLISAWPCAFTRLQPPSAVAACSLRRPAPPPRSPAPSCSVATSGRQLTLGACMGFLDPRGPAPGARRV